MAGMNAELRDENSEGNYTLTVYISRHPTHKSTRTAAPPANLVQISIVYTRRARGLVSNKALGARVSGDAPSASPPPPIDARRSDDPRIVHHRSPRSDRKLLTKFRSTSNRSIEVAPPFPQNELGPEAVAK